ncbi:hypothetical protein BDV95DRAFT_381941 [Massariosphaeria phaeospora]|uniref:Uncharacterized protein n=1 Tax=Massariosphaeria phaeospora TaxID=100035 RepID=A0A7C8MQ86_9PLEO|nr:hypothetical protein BDV95DRAFT_381941 [Massariosphaeria phaeospora]
MSVWDKLSVEVYDEIFSHLAVPTVNYSYVLHTFDDICGIDRLNYGDGDGFMQLRFVCKAFDRAITRAYFKEKPAVFHACQERAVQRLQEYIIDEQTVIAPQVTRLEIDLSPAVLHLFDTNYRGYYTESVAGPGNVHAFISKLEEAVSKLPKLERLVVTTKEKVRSEGPVDVDSDDNDDEERGPVLDLDLVKHVRSNIARIFSSPRIRLRLLTYLRLVLPCAHDLATIGAQISDDIAMQLRHLYLECIDGTGPGGDRYYTKHWQGDSDSDGDETHPYSNLQKRFPNKNHMADLSTLISRCHSLKSLGLAGTQCMDLRSLNWRPTKAGLENIYISRGIMPSSTLLSLLSPAASSPGLASNIVSFQIEDVQLLDCTWELVFDHLVSCPLLRFIHVYNLVYARYGESAHLRLHNNRPWENNEMIWSEEDGDILRLRDVVRKVQERGGDPSADLVEFAAGYDTSDEE